MDQYKFYLYNLFTFVFIWTWTHPLVFFSSSAHTVSLVTEWTPLLKSQPTLSNPRWPASGPCSSPKASQSLLRTPLPSWPIQSSSPRLHRGATQTTTPLQSESWLLTHFSDGVIWWVSVLFSFFRFNFEREGSPEEFYNPYEDPVPGATLQSLP